MLFVHFLSEENPFWTVSAFPLYEVQRQPLTFPAEFPSLSGVGWEFGDSLSLPGGFLLAARSKLVMFVTQCVNVKQRPVFVREIDPVSPFFKSIVGEKKKPYFHACFLKCLLYPQYMLYLFSTDSASLGKNRKEENYVFESKSDRGEGEHPAPETGNCTPRKSIAECKHLRSRVLSSWGYWMELQQFMTRAASCGSEELCSLPFYHASLLSSRASRLTSLDLSLLFYKLIGRGDDYSPLQV